jgi:hypothetical protein
MATPDDFGAIPVPKHRCDHCGSATGITYLEARMEKVIEHVRARRIRPQEAELYVFPSGANGRDQTRLITDETEHHSN